LKVPCRENVNRVGELIGILTDGRGIQNLCIVCNGASLRPCLGGQNYPAKTDTHKEKHEPESACFLTVQELHTLSPYTFYTLKPGPFLLKRL